jgi:hypothetical protein
MSLPEWYFTLDTPKAEPDTPDDDFEGGTLDEKWTVVDGSSGVCDLAYGGGSRYDITSRDGWLLMQADNGNHVTLRQDYELPDGASIVVKVAPSAMADAQAGIANNEIQTGVWLNDNDAGPESGNWTGILWDTNSEGWRVGRFGGLGTTVSTPSASNVCSAPIAAAIYLRYIRDGLTYYAFWSTDGTVWFPLTSATASAALDNIWIGVRSNASFGNPTPIQAFDFVRQGGDGLDPW